MRSEEDSEMILMHKFLYLFKSKYRRKWGRWTDNLRLNPRCYFTIFIPRFSSLFILLSYIVAVIILVKPPSVKTAECVSTPANSSIINQLCLNGDCINNTCVCRPGWIGAQCQFCNGKIKLDGDRGWISDGLGNYSANMKCTWLIESRRNINTSSPLPLFLRLEEFATECGWDHLYIYDGDSVHSPLLAVFSGILVQNSYRALRLPEITAKSGYALLHFYTDVAYNLTGFNISYRSLPCPSNDINSVCSGNGVCVDGKCTCNAPYTGVACNIEKCPNNCSNHGTCDMEKHQCQCDEGYKGFDCQQQTRLGYWEVLLPNSTIPKGSASHAALIHNNSLWIIGGSSLSLDSNEPIVIKRYDFKVNTWEIVHAKGDSLSHPPSLYGHSCVVYEGKIILYGGVLDGKFGNRHVSNDVWSFEISSKKWNKVTVKSDKCKRSMCGPQQLAGHTAVVINDKGNKSRHSRMVIISGHSPIFGYMNVVQEFHFGSSNWNVVTTKGYPFSGSYGHSSTWDPITQKIYVFGGYKIGTDSSSSLNSAYLSNTLLSYDPSSHTWHLLDHGPHGRFLHASAIHRGLLFVFGGNGHNDTTYSHGSKCFTSEILVYDITCESWTTMNPPDDIPSDVSRYGHSFVTYHNSMVIYGGFNGIIQNDLIRFNPSICSVFESKDECLNSVKHGVKCIWNKLQGLCESFGVYYPKDKEKDKEKEWAVEKCSRSPAREIDEKLCLNFSSCSACLQNTFECTWCGNQCHYSKCNDSIHQGVTSFDQCKNEETLCGNHLHNCYLCSSEQNCFWLGKDGCGKENVSYHGVATVDKEINACDQSCSDYVSCSNCTSNNCMWCNNLNTCVDKNAYVISFPYGQCMSWSQSSSSCLSKDALASSSSLCDDVASCDICLSIPSCGWCDNGSGTGLGKCMDGSSRGALSVNTTNAYLNSSACPDWKWHFTSCPACQCNGHSECDENNGCVKCEDHTESERCERCVPGFYGHAVNGGRCNPCECNGQAQICQTETGRCYCTTKGMIGEDCSRCDTQNHYSGDPSKGSCFYDLQIDFQFTFNLSKKEDRHFTKINFRNTPTKQDIDADFQITCSMMAKMNITFTEGGQDEILLFNATDCTTFKHRFARSKYQFGSPENTTFYVYVYDFHPPLWIQISFSQSPKLDLLHFFITFSTCFLVLLVIAALLWKIKQKYDMYRRRQRLFVEMEQMASRPFSQVYVEIGKSQILPRISTLRKRRKEWPSPIALEPCHGNKAAVLSLLITLPTGSQQFAPPGQSGLSVGSTLVALGNPRKVSFEPASKTDGKGNKIRKSLPSHSLNTCI